MLQSLIKDQLLEMATYLDVEGGLLLGHNVCYIDFYLFELILLVEFLTNDEVYTWYPCLRAYKDQMTDLSEQLQAFLKLGKRDGMIVTDLPFNMRFAKVNNWKDGNMVDRPT